MEFRPVGGAAAGRHPADEAKTATAIPSENESGTEAAAATPAAVAYWYQRDPSMHPAQIAEKIGKSERTVRRYWPPSKLHRANAHPQRRHADRPWAS